MSPRMLAPRTGTGADSQISFPARVRARAGRTRMVGVILLWRCQILTGVDAQYLASRVSGWAPPRREEDVMTSRFADIDWILWSGTVGLEKPIPERVEAAVAAEFTSISVSPLDIHRAEQAGTPAKEVGRFIRDRGLRIIVDPVMNWHPFSGTSGSRFSAFSAEQSLRWVEALEAARSLPSQWMTRMSRSRRWASCSGACVTAPRTSALRSTWSSCRSPAWPRCGPRGISSATLTALMGASCSTRGISSAATRTMTCWRRSRASGSSACRSTMRRPRPGRHCARTPATGCSRATEIWISRVWSVPSPRSTRCAGSDRR